jgi:hypothetical protein
MLAIAGVTTVVFGGWVFWYFTIRPPAVHRPTHYNLFEISLLPTGLIVAGALLLLAAAGTAGRTGRYQ